MRRRASNLCNVWLQFGSSSVDQSFMPRRSGLNGTLERFRMTTNGIGQSLEASQNAWSSHLIVPGVYSMTGSITFPFSTALLILKTANVIAMVANTVASAKCIPGHVLNTIDQSLAPYTCRIHWPPSESEYHATRISFYLLALWRNKPIGIKHLWTGIRLFITCHFPM